MITGKDALRSGELDSFNDRVFERYTTSFILKAVHEIVPFSFVIEMLLADTK